MRMLLPVSGCLILLLGDLAVAQPAARPGPAIGERLAAMQPLLDQQGRPADLSSVVGPSGGLVAVLRSAEWWPSCKVQLVELQGFAARLRARGWRLGAVTIDRPEVLQAFTSEHGLTYPLFSGRDAIARMGLTDPRFNADPQRSGAPFPVIYLLNAEGRITERFFEDEGVPLQSILARTGVVARRIVSESDARLARVTVWTPDVDIGSTGAVTVAFDIAPAPGIHLYARGNHAYGSVNVRLSSNNAGTALPLSLPPSTPYTFKPLNETVPVYMRPFSVFQDIRVSRAVAAATFEISGQLELQGCDDRVCYPLQRVPFSVTSNGR